MKIPFFEINPETGDYYEIAQIVQSIIDSAEAPKRQVAIGSDISIDTVNKWLKGEGLKSINGLRSLHASAVKIIADKPCEAKAAFEGEEIAEDTWED